MTQPSDWTIAGTVAGVVAALATGAAAWGSMRSAAAARDAVRSTIRPLIAVRRAAPPFGATMTSDLQVKTARFTLSLKNVGPGVAILGTDPFSATWVPKQRGRLVIPPPDVPNVLAPGEEIQVQFVLGYWEDRPMGDAYSFTISYTDPEEGRHRTVVGLRPATGNVVSLNIRRQPPVRDSPSRIVQRYLQRIGKRMAPVPAGRPGPSSEHVAALLRARDGLHFYTSRPSNAIFPVLSEQQQRTEPADPRFAVVEDADPTREMLRQHTHGHRFWGLASDWEKASAAYIERARDLVHEIETLALSETGMERAYERGGETYGPQDPPKVLQRFILGPFDYVLRVYEGTAEGPWKSQIQRFAVEETGTFRLDAGFGSQMQPVAVGPIEELEHAREVMAKIISRLQEPTALPSLIDAFGRCERLTNEVEAAKLELTEAVLREGRCWVCSSGDGAMGTETKRRERTDVRE